jgi:Zn-finger nucleic acid-binding protein
MIRVTKRGVTIDTCGACGGVWLDKGELGELLARTQQAGSSVDQELSRVPPPRPDYGRGDHQEGDHRHGDDHDDHGHHGKYTHKKRSIWDIFG